MAHPVYFNLFQLFLKFLYLEKSCLKPVKGFEEGVVQGTGIGVENQVPGGVHNGGPADLP